VGRIRGWPATLSQPELLAAPVQLRPVGISDARTWHELREANALWLAPWKATNPDVTANPEDSPRRSQSNPYVSFARRTVFWGFTSMLLSRWRSGHGGVIIWVVCYGGQVAGQVSLFSVERGSNRSGKVGYWIDEKFAGLGIMPTALAMVVDHSFSAMKLHRIEASIRPDNKASRRVVEKLGFREEGFRLREVHIDGAWRDHISYAITVEDVPDGLLSRWRLSHPMLARSMPEL
jgi:ribosomal-protein-alanine N-acetyltransferase